METLLLIDGNAIVHRAFHALPPFKTKNNIQTNAVYGFFSMINKAVNDFSPSYIIVCFDTPVPTFRKKVYVEYQAHRPKIDANLIPQITYIKEGLDKAGILHLEKEGFEADDIIGTIAKKYHANGTRVLILTGDKDMMQLINDKVFVVTPQIGLSTVKIYNEEEVQKKFDVQAHQIPDLKALMGDAADNYKGAKGIGPKTAAKLLNQHQTVDNIFSSLDKIDFKIKKILEDHKEHIFLSKKLATIITDVELDITLEKARFNSFKKELKDFFIEFEMYSMAKRFFKETKKEQKAKEPDKPKDDQMGLF